MEMFRLHLNGGPRDDQFVDHWMTRLEVTLVRSVAGIDQALDPIMPLQHGRYEVRLDMNGEFVPHDLEGYVEADWQGWSE